MRVALCAATLRLTLAQLRAHAQFSLPELRVGTLDSLLTLSDELVKTSTLVEGVTSKIRRQLAELDRASAEVRGVACVTTPARTPARACRPPATRLARTACAARACSSPAARAWLAQKLGSPKPVARAHWTAPRAACWLTRRAPVRSWAT